MPEITTQASKLLPHLFAHPDTQQTVTVFHVGTALPETVDFFSHYRCKLYFIDVFSALPIVSDEDATLAPAQQFQQLLQVPPDTVFDICLFWDLFNFLDSDAIRALLSVLHPHFRKGTMAHAFSVHNRKAPQQNNYYGIKQTDALSVRSRHTPPPCYSPHSQRELSSLLDGFRVERSVLLPDSRLELLLLRL